MSQYAYDEWTQDAALPYVARLLLLGNAIIVVALYPNDMVSAILYRSLC